MHSSGLSRGSVAGLNGCEEGILVLVFESASPLQDRTLSSQPFSF